MLGGLAVGIVDQLSVNSRDAALLAIDSHPNKTVAHLSRALGRTHSATVRLVDGLVRDGLVLRRTGCDPRTVALTLTESGATAARQLRENRAHVLNELTSSMSQEEAAALEPLLEKLLAATARDAASRWRTCRLCEEASCEDGQTCPVDAAAPPDGSRDE
ncbi:DNA-binding transcriptional regulator, MarR family [Brevibacterium sandarakinum]|uniref:DNA-binding transcriptional regulator, MarR family n=2 Tax=Brevibacterium sandarakinum TaxID=629680 RepID=A0A1H1XDP9_BRESA|nr:DNA-binding transcriptional regulator, MarR family [Brevibacterium sandarakinum]